MNLNFSSINFKGYDVAPLKALHIDSWTSDAIRSELEEIGKNENIEIRDAFDYYKWAQDMKMIIKKNGKPFVVANNRVDENYLDQIKRKYGIDSKVNDLIATGGNTFIGKYPIGVKWMLIGVDELDTKSLDYLSQEYGIKQENIFSIPQQNYHLDMFIRPIGYPYVLVDSPALTRQKFSKMDW